MTSEVAALRQRMEAECLAMKQALSGYAVVSRHDMIAHRFEAIGTCQKQLTAFVGSQEAQRMLCETYGQVFDIPEG